MKPRQYKNEWSTSLTDILLMTVCAALAAKVFSLTPAPGLEIARNAWGLAIAGLGFGALLGALFHGLRSMSRLPRVQTGLIAAAMTLLITSSWLMLSGGALSHFPNDPLVYKILITAFFLKACVFLALAFREKNFTFIDIDQVMTVGLLGLMATVSGPSASLWPWVMAFAFSVAAALVQASGFRQNTWLNNNDLYHFLLMPAIGGVYLGLTASLGS